MVERFLRDITQNRIRRGVFQNLEQLIVAIGEYIHGHNQNPKPFIWESIKIRALSRGQSRSQGGEDKMGLRWPSLRWFGSTNSRLCSGE
jgi:hypothetical protein